MRKRWILLSLALCRWAWASSQVHQQLQPNLVYNASFEEYRECPRKIDALGTLTIVDAWYQPTSGSADYFNVCGSRECGVPKNKLGIQDAHLGNGFCGIYCSKTDYREYLQTQLKEPLRAGEMYRVSFYVSLSEYSSGAVATIGALFSADRVCDTVRSVLMNKEVRNIASGISQTVASYYEPQVVNAYDRVLTDTKAWMQISGTFTAQGGERYMTIGNFFPASQSNVVDLDSLTYLLPGAYYYIDDVSVVCLGCKDTTGNNIIAKDTMSVTSSPVVSPMGDSLQVGATFVLRNIFFDYDKAVLLQQSYNELQQLLTIMQHHPEMRIEVRGHTDGHGSIDYNQRLSENRAKAVVEFLVSKGIDERRLQYKGFGKSMPIASNATEEGRAQNRRVEFRILSM